MGSREVYGSVSSLVVRPSDSGGGGGAHGNEYEPGEIRRDEQRHRHNHYYHRDRPDRERDRDRDRDRFTPPGYNMKGYKGSLPTGSASPMRQRKVEPYGHDYDRNGGDFDRGGRDLDRGVRGFDRGVRGFDRGRDRGVRDFGRGARDFNREFDHSGPPRGRGFRGGRGRGRFRDRSPPLGVGRGRPPFGRGFSGPGYGSEPFQGESAGRNNPNVAPREGDWICSEPTCGNLNFARRSHCNNCNKPRRDIAPFSIGVGSPNRGFQGRGGFQGPPPSHLPLMDGPPMGRGMGRGGNGFGPPPPVRWGRGGPREFDQAPPPRPAERFSDFRPARDLHDRPEFREHDDYRDREKFGRPPPVNWEFPLGPRDRERDDRFHDKRGPHDTRNDRRPPSPPPRGHWGRDLRDRSRSPIRSASKDYYREPYMDQRRDDKRGGRRDRLDDAY